MSRHRSTAARLLSLVATVSLLLAFMPGVTVASTSDVVPPNARVRGASYAEWSARWWQWAAALPAEDHPLAQEGNVDCGQDQTNRHVWFLGGNTTGGDTERSCSIPSGTFLLIPLVNVECSSVEGNGSTAEELRACVQQPLYRIDDLYAEVDGVSISGLDDYLVTSPAFEITFADPNIFGAPSGTGLSVGRGAYLLVSPLPVGDHTITFGGSFPEADFSVDITYNLDVQPRGQYAN